MNGRPESLCADSQNHAALRLVYGVVTAEKPDVSGEVCDYASTKPLYQKWSQGFASATDGRSLGNLRAMHGAVD